MSRLSPEEARELLRFHAGRHEDVNHPESAIGFLGSLRPYRGLNERNYHEVMGCLIALATDLSEPGWIGSLPSLQAPAVVVVSASVVAAAFAGLVRAVRPAAASSPAFAFAGRLWLAAGGRSGQGQLLGKGS